MLDATGCTITLYTQSGCADSAGVRRWLTDQEISFTERNISNDPNSASALARTGIFATPLLTICAHTVFGNRPHLIAHTINACEFRHAV